jgi:hypothetical protein
MELPEVSRALNDWQRMRNYNAELLAEQTKLTRELDAIREVLSKAHAHLLAYNYDGHTYGENAAMLAEITAALAKHGR